MFLTPSWNYSLIVPRRPTIVPNGSQDYPTSALKIAEKQHGPIYEEEEEAEEEEVDEEDDDDERE